MKTDLVIKILFIENSVEDAEQIISMLRNAGIAVRPTRATNAEQLDSTLKEQGPDVVLFDPAIGTLELRDVARQLESLGRDQALIGLVDKLSSEVVTSMFVNGARAVALRSQPKQMMAVIQREVDSLNTRRQLRRLEAALRESERRCDALLDSSNDAIAYVHEGMHVRANRAYLDTFGYESFDDLLGLPMLDMIGSDDADAFKALLRSHLRDEPAAPRIELRARRADGSLFSATAEFAHAMFEGEPCLQIVFRRQQVDPNLIEQLQRDAVTGLFNRARMLEFIDDAVAAAANGQKDHSLLLVEPDNWASLVAQIGLGKADELLAAFAARLSARLDEHAAAGLLAEHTIGVVLRTQSDAAIRDWVAAVQHDIAKDIFDLGSQSLTVTASIGGSLLGETNANTELLLNQASEALRNAQSQGVNRSELHDPAAREKADDERERYWLDLLKQALANDEFILYHQQTISLHEAEGEYSEILLRMKGPQGEVMPGFFMPIAEKFGLGNAIDRWVLNRTIDILKARDSINQHTTFFVKLTTQSIQDDTLLAWLGTRMRQAALRHGRIVLEMTESKVVTLLRPAQEFVNGWKKLGGSFALEQFGSGLNSFQLLSHIDADFLKIDRSFMADLAHHQENQKAVADICDKAREVKRQTIAEWVENAASTSLLFACGVDFVQGNFLQEPQPLHQRP
jgi:multidomain signaling protein FimX